MTQPAHAPTDIQPLSASYTRITAVAQSTVMNPSAPLGLWRLVAGLDAAFRAGRDLHVTLVSDQDLEFPVIGAEDERTQVFTSLNAESLLIICSTNLILIPELQAEVTIREHVATRNGGLTETRVAHVQTSGLDLRDMHHPDLPGGHAPLKPNERAVPLSELLPDCDQAYAELVTMTTEPLELLRSIYPNHPYPRALTGAAVPAPALPGGYPHSVCAALPDELRTGALGDLTDRIDAAFRSGRDLRVFLTTQHKTLTISRRNDGFLHISADDNEHPTPRIKITVLETQQDTLNLDGTVDHLLRIAQAHVLNGQLMDTPYLRGSLHQLHIITPLETMLPPLRA